MWLVQDDAFACVRFPLELTFATTADETAVSTTVGILACQLVALANVSQREAEMASKLDIWFVDAR